MDLGLVSLAVLWIGAIASSTNKSPDAFSSLTYVILYSRKVRYFCDGRSVVGWE